MPLINVQIVAGRTPEQKRKLMQGLARAAMEAIDAPEHTIRVILTEVPPENWGMGLGTKAEP